MHDILLTPIRLNELETLITNSVRKALSESQNLPLSNNRINSDNLTIQEAAKFLNLAVPTVYGMVSRKEIPFSKPRNTKRLYFSKQELSDWIKSGRKKTVSEIAADASNHVRTKKNRS